MMGSVVQFDTQKSVSAWTETIHNRWAKGLDAVFDTGQAMLDAKAALPHGDFEDMIRRRLPFGVGTARKLMTIAAKTFLANRSIRHVLPTAWTTVYELCHFDDAELERWLAQGRIKPTLTALDLIVARKSRRERPNKHATPTVTLSEPEARPPIEPHLWAEKMIDTLQVMVRQFDGVDLAAVHRGMKHQQIRDLAALIRTARNWFDVLEVSKMEGHK